MKKILFLSGCVIFFMFSCLDTQVEDVGGQGRKTGRDGKGDDGSGRNSQVKKVCKGQSYTVYSYEDCPEDRGTSVDTSVHSRYSKKPVDILFVIDTSTSMHFYLIQAFKKRFESFISIIDNSLDWRVFFTNAEYYYSKYKVLNFLNPTLNGKAMKLEDAEGILNRNYLDRTVPYCDDVFLYTISRDPVRTNDDGQEENYYCSYPPYCQGNEQPLRALQASFQANKPITRKEADFVAVIVSNTDENPDGGSSSVTAKKVIDEFKKVYGSSKRLTVLSLIVLPGDKKCEQENNHLQLIGKETSMGKRIADLAKEAGGGNFSICLDDYSIVAETIVNLAYQ